MSSRRHEIPTHLNVEDKAFYGLGLRQVMLLAVGIAVGYGLWGQWPEAPLALRLAPAGLGFLPFAALGLLRPAGRGLEEWLVVAIAYALAPRAAVWRHEERPANLTQAGRWASVELELAWEGER